MTASEIKTLVGQLATILKDGGPSATDRDLADQYAEECQSVNERLAQCARMIDEGSSLQALMLAEEKPNLLDAVAALSFAKSTDWHEGCALNALRQAPRLDRSAIHKLNELYNKGTNSERTKALYREFRGAMATRNDALALDTIRTIARLDPADGDAAKELARLERKRREDSVKALRVALQSNDDALVISWLEECEKLDITEADELAAAGLIRARVRAREAMQEVSQIVPTLPDLQAQGRWQQCSERAARVKSLAATHGFAISTEQLSIVAAAAAYFETCREDAMRKARFKEAVAAVSNCADGIQGGALTGAKHALEHLEEERLHLRKAFEKAREFMMPIPEGLVARVAQIATSLDGEIERLRRARKMRTISVATGLAILLLAAVAGGYYVIRANQFAGELRSLIASSSAMPLRQLASQIREQHAIYTGMPALKSALLEADAWLEGAEAQRQAAEAAVARASSLADSNFEGSTPEEASATFKQADETLGRIPHDLANALNPRLTVPKGKLAIWLAARRDERIAATKADLEKAREMSAIVAGAETGEALKQALAPLQETVSALLVSTESPVEEMRLPQAMRAGIEDLSEKVKHYATVLQSHDAAMAELSSATSPEEYAQALSKVAQVQLPKSQVTRAAQQLTTMKLGAHELLGAMILPSAPEVWAAIKSPQDLVTQPRPEQTREAEVDRLRNLINDENLAGIYEAVLQNRNGPAATTIPGRKIFTRGRLQETQDTEQGTGERRTISKGIVYDPAYSAGRLDFRDRTFIYKFDPDSATATMSGERVDGQKESDASKAMQRFGLKQLVNNDGSKYTQSILDVTDRVKNTRDAPSLVRAYVVQELTKIANLRPGAWGLAWAPAITADLNAMKKEVGSYVDSGDWMLPAKAQVSARLSAWFKQREDFSYAAQQQLNRQLAKAALDAGLVIYGYVGPNGEPVQRESGKGNAPTELWGLNKEGKPALLYIKREKSDGQPFKAVSAGLTLSPLFASPLDRPRAVESALKAAQIPADAAGPYISQVPPMFRPYNTAPAP